MLISKAFIDSNISHGEFVLISNEAKEHDDMKEDLNSLSKKLVYL